MFKAMDTDSSGAITFDELKAGLRRYGSTLKESEIRDLMDAVRCCYQVDFILLSFVMSLPFFKFFLFYFHIFIYLFIIPFSSSEVSSFHFFLLMFFHSKLCLVFLLSGCSLFACLFRKFTSHLN